LLAVAEGVFLANGLNTFFLSFLPPPNVDLGLLPRSTPRPGDREELLDGALSFVLGLL
jgi:hypothetical protein